MDQIEVGRHRPRAGGRGHGRVPLAAAGRRGGPASLEVVDRARSRAADVLEANAADVVLDKGSGSFAVAGRTPTRGPLGRLAAHERLLVLAVFAAPGPTYPFGAHVAVAQVDMETGKVVLAGSSPSTTPAP